MFSGFQWQQHYVAEVPGTDICCYSERLQCSILQWLPTDGFLDRFVLFYILRTAKCEWCVVCGEYVWCACGVCGVLVYVYGVCVVCMYVCVACLYVCVVYACTCVTYDDYEALQSTVVKTPTAGGQLVGSLKPLSTLWQANIHHGNHHHGYKSLL